MTAWQQLFCSHTHPRPLGWDIKVKTFFLSVSSHVAYQIKGHEVYDSMAAIVLLSLTSSTPGVRCKGQNIFSLCK